MERLDIRSNDLCRSCGSEEEKETVFYFMCQQPDHAKKRRKFLGSHIFELLINLYDIKVAAISKFILDLD